MKRPILLVVLGEISASDPLLERLLADAPAHVLGVSPPTSDRDDSADFATMRELVNVERERLRALADKEAS